MYESMDKEEDVRFSDLNLKLRTYRITPNTLLVIQYIRGDTTEAKYNALCEILDTTLEEMCVDKHFLIIPDDIAISLLDEELMKALGWIRDPARRI